MDKLSAVINVLNSIEVHGKNNLNALLACIQTLEEILQEVNNATDNKHGQNV